MRLLLHIGPPKTGTSTLQSFFSNSNYDSLIDQGILYPITGRRFLKETVDRHIGLRFACEPIENKPTGMMIRENIDDACKRKDYSEIFFHSLEKELLPHRNIKTTIISDEALFIFANSSMISTIKDKLGKLFNRIDIVICLRDPAEYLCSTYSQSIKQGDYILWETALSKYLQEDIYFSKIKLWSDIFGTNNIIIKVLKDNILKVFQEIVPLELNTISKYSNLNKSLSPLGIALLKI